MPSRPALRIAYFHPFDLHTKSGAALFANLLLRFLRDKGYAVAAVSVRKDGKEGVTEEEYLGIPNLIYSPWMAPQIRSNPLRMLREMLAHWGPRLFHAVGIRVAHRSRVFYRPRFWADLDALANFSEFKHDRKFQEMVERKIAAADIVMLDYPFWAEILTPICRKHGKPLILSDLDVIAQTNGSTAWIKKRIAAKERRALQGATVACAVSDRDTAYFRAQGLTVHNIPIPIDVFQCGAEVEPAAVAELRRRFDLGDAPFCLFLGSRTIPNMQAMANVETMAERVPGVQFVVAGGVTDTVGTTGNLHKLGLVSDADLAVLYVACLAVIIPLESGTGASLKFIEALAYGKPIVTTHFGYRGYPFVSGEHGLLVERMDEFPAAITRLVQDPEEARRLGENARKLAETFHYETVFERYVELIDECMSVSQNEPQDGAAEAVVKAS